MKIVDFFKQRLVFIIVNLFLFSGIAALLIVVEVHPTIVFFCFLMWFIPLISYMIGELIKYKRYLDPLKKTLENLDKAYLLPEIIKEPEFIEAKIMYEALKKSNKAMHEQVKTYRMLQEEYREYIETWVHEIKTPIASIDLIVKNDENPTTYKISYETKRIEGYIDQVLYYAKSNNTEKDYIIKDFMLESVVKRVIKNNAKDCIRKKIKIQLGSLEEQIYSDIKWVEFILNQVFINAVKYSRTEAAIIKIYSVANKYSVTLIIEDNGVGISEKDVSKVFLKGFTGENGRQFGKSTGIGLYLCKKLCDKLGLSIGLTSKKGEGTKISIVFPVANRPDK